MKISPPSGSPPALFLLGCLCAAQFTALHVSCAAGPVTASTGRIELPTYGWAAVKHPYFRGTDKINIYPYAMLDFLSREKTNRVYRTVVLENEYLRITFLPELGGKIQEIIDKTTGQPMFYVNQVVKPGLLGQCGAWTSGGVEWNTGPQGHTVSCMLPVEVRILEPDADGSRSVAIGETERIYGTHWTVVVTLRPGRSFIEERIRIYNPTETVRPYYFWNCTAVPNTPGFRFIYPMTLGMDHSGDKFFQWPIDDGKDLSRGANYQDASSIFAYQCDQDFFGSYNDDLDRGVVSTANHHQLRGKKAWTWGHGSYGTMHQADLTDADGPYNEVQTGPLLTQGEVGRLDPCEAVEWQEWWYPIHGLGGFSFANREVAVNVTNENGRMVLRLLGTGSWNDARVSLSKDGRALQSRATTISARQTTVLDLPAEGLREPFHVELTAGQQVLARFRVPLDLPGRTPPPKKSAPQTASEFVEAGWQHFLIARFPEAETQFRKALALETNCPAAETALAYLNLDRDPTAAVSAGRAALAIDPADGRARFALAVAEARLDDEQAALDDAWEAALDPATAVPGRALVAKLLLRRHDLARVVAALSQPGPWSADPLCGNRLALALMKEAAGGTRATSKAAKAAQVRARALAAANLRVDPLDSFARSILAGPELESPRGSSAVLADSAWTRLELLADYADVGTAMNPAVLAILCARPATPLENYWHAYLVERGGVQTETPRPTTVAAGRDAVEPAFPYQYEMLPVLKWAGQKNSNDGQAALYLGDLLFHLGRSAEARAEWKRAAHLGFEPVIACRALGMAAKNLDGDLIGARDWLEKANHTDPTDVIVARDLANVLVALADQAKSSPEKQVLTAEARDRLQAAFAAGKGRSDYVALLGRALTRLGQYAETARMLDQVRVTVWEGTHEVHDLFEQAHLELGDSELKAGHLAEALAEFNRALEYPANLATGKLETTHQAHIQYRRGQALAALGRPDEARVAYRLAASEPASSDASIESARQKAKQALAN